MTPIEAGHLPGVRTGRFLPLKVIIAGSRTETRFGQLLHAINGCGWPIASFAEVVSGGARGVDHLGERWAEIVGIKVKRFPAKWHTYGSAAGRQRNIEMAVYANALIAVWDGSSPGTRHMIETAERMGLKVFVYRIRSGD
jgi:hypothetical protein